MSGGRWAVGVGRWEGAPVGWPRLFIYFDGSSVARVEASSRVVCVTFRRPNPPTPHDGIADGIPIRRPAPAYFLPAGLPVQETLPAGKSGRFARRRARSFPPPGTAPFLRAPW